MKSDATTTALNFVLAVLVILGVIFASLSILRTHKLRELTLNATLVNTRLAQARALAMDAAAYNATAKSPAMDRILDSIRSHPADEKPATK